MNIVKNIKLDLNKKIFEKIEFRRGDTANMLQFTVTRGGVPFNLEGYDIRLFIKKPNGNIIFNDCIVNSLIGIVSIKLTNAMTDVDGVNYCELVVYDNQDIFTTI